MSSGISSNKLYFATFDISEKMIKIFEADTIDFTERLLVSFPFNDHEGIFEGEDANDTN